jgi:hypothetical protein
MEMFEIHPTIGKRHPLLWFKSLVFWNNSGARVREIPFHLGMNIIWCPQDILLPGGSGRKLADQRGKTIVTRLLRYCMGEKHFGTDLQQVAIRKAFPNSVVGAVVVLEGVEWSVVRSLFDSQTSAADEGDVLQNLKAKLHAGQDDSSFKEFRRKIKAVLAPTLVIPGKDPTDIALGFISRDHDGGFKDPFTWRTPNNNSGSRYAREERARDLLALLGVRSSIVPVNRRKQKARDELNSAARSQMLARVAATFALPWDRSTSSDKLRSLVENHEKKTRQGFEKAQKELRVQQSKLQVAERGRDGDTLELSRLKAQLRLSKQERQQLRRVSSGMPACKLQASDECKYAKKPLQTLLTDNKCLFPKAGYDPKVMYRPKTALDEVVEVLDQNIRRVQERVNEIEESLKKDEVSILKCEVAKIEHELEEQRAKLEKAEAYLDLLADLNKQFPSPATPKGRAKKARSQPEETKENEQESLSFLTRAQRVAELLISPDATPKLEITEENQLRFWIERDGVAVKDVQSVLTFDVAALLRSIEANISHPGLLIHDTPRQDDLSDGDYRPLFEFFDALERAWPGEPGFQYILTTSSAPPDQCQKKQVVLTLAPETLSKNDEFLLRKHFGK